MDRIQPNSIQASDGKVGAIAVAGNVNAWTKAQKIAFAQVFCLSVKATKTSGNVDVTISIEQSHQDATADSASDTTYVLPEGFSASIIQITDETWHHIPISPASLPYARFKLAGGASNHASVTLDMKLSQQEALN